MIDLSQLSDEELLKYTKDLSDDEISLICRECGREFTVPKHHHNRKFCDECSEEKQNFHKSYRYRKQLPRQYPRIKNGSLGERWHLEYDL